MTNSQMLQSKKRWRGDRERDRQIDRNTETNTQRETYTDTEKAEVPRC